MNKNLLIIIALLCGAFSSALAQKGFLRGQIVDPELGETVIGANIYVEGTTTGTVSDFDGNYSLPLDAGTYTIVFSSISYVTTTVSEVVIKADEVTSLNINMSSDVQQLEGVVVTAEVIKDSESALLSVQKKSVNVMDGISSQTFRKIGDSDLSGAMKRVTGVSVEGGKYVYVRGLGDRYTKTTLNGMNIPGLDPDKNSVQIDIFPTAVLNNVMVYKTFSPDLYGDFTGGAIDVETKDFPEERTTSFTVGLRMIPGVQFNDEYILYKGSSTDWLGFDNGTRAIPFPKSTVIPSEGTSPILEDLTRSFKPQMAVEKMRALPSGIITFNTGNQIDKEKVTLGYNVVLNYRNNYRFYDESQTNNFLKDNDRSVNELFRDETREGVVGMHEVMWSALLSGALKYDNSSFSLSLLHTQSGESTSSDRINRNFNQTGATLLENILTYTQRSVSNAVLSGKHSLANRIQLDWRGAVNLSRVYDPDFRITSISVSQGDTTLNPGDGAGISRFYRDLNELNTSFKVDLSIPYAQKSKLKFGATTNFKERDFEILNYLFRQRGVGQVSSDPNWFFESENIWTPESRNGTYVIGNFEPTNSFEASQWIHGAYAMTELFVSESFRTVFGVRMEQSSMYYTGQNNSGTVVYENERTLNELNLLPSVNLIYSVNENMNLRGSFNQTLARPSFKEKSIAQIFDPISRRTFVGNIDLLQTNVNNYDLRWEMFMKPGELISVSGFYKSFENHIELVSFPQDPDAIKPRNAGSSRVYGAEVELRKDLEFIAPALKNLSIGANVSVVRSAVDMNTVFVDNSQQRTEKELRENNARDGQVIANTRSMAGQAPYLINGYFNYLIPEIDLNINVAYNVQGSTLAVVGSGRVPDVYSVPFHGLSFNAYKGLGVQKRSRITFGLQNILDDKREQVYKSFQAQDQVYSTFNPGTQISLKYTYTF